MARRCSAPTLRTLGHDLSNVAAGTHALTAKAIDDAGATTTSTTVNITVRLRLPGGARHPPSPQPPCRSRGSTSVGDNSTNETGFRIERSTNGTSFSQIATVGANVQTYASTGLKGNKVLLPRPRDECRWQLGVLEHGERHHAAQVSVVAVSKG
jgi:hypothetical protein